jgi:hypothetical protein
MEPDNERYVHYPIALKVGIKPEIIDAIAEERRPTGVDEDEEIVYDLSSERHQNKRVSDHTFERAESASGRRAWWPDGDQCLLHAAGHGDECRPLRDSKGWQEVDALSGVKEA